MTLEAISERLYMLWADAGSVEARKRSEWRVSQDVLAVLEEDDERNKWIGIPRAPTILGRPFHVVDGVDVVELVEVS